VFEARPGHGLKVAVTRTAARCFGRCAPAQCAFAPPVQFAATTEPVHGYVVGVTEGTRWGWWGPVTAEVASSAEHLFSRAAARAAATPEHWAARLRRGTRHAHTGALAAGVGAFELACWDLLGQLHGVPVWQLLTSRPARDRARSYATCFGIRLDHPRAPEVVAAVAEIWPVQKWRPVRRLTRRSHPCARAVAAAGPGRVALDFGGMWEPAAVQRFCAALGVALSWAEEPCPPGELTGLPPRWLPVPIAAGEHCYNPDDVTALDQAGVDIWQPDAVYCGGFARLRDIAAAAVAHCRSLCPHGGGLIPALHAAVAGSVTSLIEFHLLLELRRQTHLAEPLVPVSDGRFPVPELPGWAGPLHPELDQ
jgi:L-alanine-DL-glutamate epimerase-like enolase superfamily enzyme